MTQETYRFAFEEANAELRDIAVQFEQLRLRKAQMEQVVEALRPLLSDAPVTADAVAAEVKAAEPAPFLVQQSAELTEEPVLPLSLKSSSEEPAYAEQSSDPFQRRIDNALRHGFGGRDSRVMSLGLNSLLTRA